MGKLNEHRVRINSQVQVSKSRIEKGMILRIRYSPILSGKTRDSAREYMILVLNPFFKKKLRERLAMLNGKGSCANFR